MPMESFNIIRGKLADGDFRSIRSLKVPSSGMPMRGLRKSFHRMKRSLPVKSLKVTRALHKSSPMTRESKEKC